VNVEDVKLREVELFLNLLKLKSVREVGRQYNMQPGQVSKWMQGLEKKLGCALMERSASGIQPTARALELMPFFEKLQDLHEELTGFSTSEKNSSAMTFASASFFSTFLIPHLVKGMLETRGQDLKVRVLEISPGQFIPAAMRGAFEYCLHSQELEWPKTWTTADAGTLLWQLYARKKHPVLKNPTMKEVLKYPFIVPIYWTAEGARYGDDQFPIPWKDRKRGHETATAASAAEILKVTDQLAFIPEIVARKGVDLGELEMVKIPSWKPVRKPVYLSVKNTTVKQHDYEWIQNVCKGVLKDL
jgi:DNA-binding transcriptional LysR family regulator